MRTPKRVKETLSPIKKTPPNTGTSSRTLQPSKVQPTPEQHNRMVAALRAEETAKLANKAPTQKAPTGNSRAAAMQMEAAKLANKAPTGSRAAAKRRRKISGGLAGALRRARSR